MSSLPSVSVDGLTSEQRSELLTQLHRFCQQRGIRTDGQRTVALTIQRDRSTEFSSLIVNFESGRILSVYPERDSCTMYTEGRVGPYLYSYNDALKVRSDEEQLAEGLSHMGMSGGVGAESEATPFCCSSVVRLNPRRLDHESEFSDFLAGRGHHPNIVYGVVRQVDNGPILYTKHYKLENNHLQEVQGNFSQKLHAFKNYKCERHNRYFSVDLFRALEGGVGGNFHHMRLIPRSHVHLDFLRRVFQDVLVPEAAAAAPSDEVAAAQGSGAGVNLTTGISSDTPEPKIISAAVSTGTSKSDAADAKAHGPGAGEAAAEAGTGTGTSSSTKSASKPATSSTRAPAYSPPRIYSTPDDDDAYSYGRGSYRQRDLEDEPDYTACDKEDCGYCGKCAY